MTTLPTSRSLQDRAKPQAAASRHRGLHVIDKFPSSVQPRGIVNWAQSSISHNVKVARRSEQEDV
ncbi:hypothetical protein IG631_15280 [Alternaria alternata]|nr:hypothetical protein IG631_15280 [Alternaria alternata]